MYWRDIVLANCSPSEPISNMNIEGRLWCHLVTSSMTSSLRKIFLAWFGTIFFISEVKMKLRSKCQNFQTGCHFKVATDFFTGSYAGSWIYQQYSLIISHILSHWKTLYLNYLRRYIELKKWFTLCPGDVIDDVTIAWTIICTTRHHHLYTCKILFVWHQSFIAKSS